MTDSFREEVLEGLSKSPKEISPKFFYNKRGSDLFDQICTLPSYYLARLSVQLLEENAEEIARIMKPQLLFEYGGGNSRKIRTLLSHLPQLEIYAPIDISKEHLMESAKQLSIDFPHIKIMPTSIDYLKMDTSHGPWAETSGKKVCFFPGSTIGNLLPEQASQLLKSTCTIVSPDGGLLVGIDLKKDVKILEKAYNDPEGVTAEFNLNLLRRLNEELGANFDLASFCHKAFYNDKQGRIEMHLESLKDQTISIGDVSIAFKKGETIHTENSYKYAIEEFQEMLIQSGFKPVKVWIDKDRFYSLHYVIVT